MSKIIKNTTGGAVSVGDTGVTIPAMSNYTIPPQDYLLWAASSNVVTYIGSGTFVINDGSFDLSISDGTDLIKGLFPTTISITPNTIEYDFSEISSVAAGVTTTILTYTAIATRKLVKIDASGTNIARYQVLLNGNVIDRQYTNFGDSLTVQFDFSEGIDIIPTDVVVVNVLHNRGTVADFNAKILLSEG